MANQVPALSAGDAGCWVPDYSVVYRDSTWGVGSAKHMTELTPKVRRTSLQLTADLLLREILSMSTTLNVNAEKRT